MNKKKIILTGGGGHSKVVISQLKKLPNFEIMGLIDNFKSTGSLVTGIKLIGTDKDLKRFYKNGINYVLTSRPLPG